MAKLTYGVYLEHGPNCYVITSDNTGYAKENAHIKMTILKSGANSLAELFDGKASYLNHPEVVEHTLPIVLSRFPEWKIAEVIVSANGVDLICSTTHEPYTDEFGEEYSNGLVTVVGDNYEIQFEISYSQDHPKERYIVSFNGEREGQCAVTEVVEYIDSRKRRHLEIREDEHGQPHINGKQYCLITEY